MFRILLQAMGIVAIVAFIGAAFTADIEQNDLYQRETSPASVMQARIAAPSSTPPILPQTAQIQTEAPPLVEPFEERRQIQPPPLYPTISPPSIATEFTWGALVNILCTPLSGSTRAISGSGVIIDPRGVVLTNAHVAQFVLLAAQPDVNLSCVIRTGSPAAGAWMAHLLYMPEAWVQEHAADIKKARPLGTGEHDYAFMVIAGSSNSIPLPRSFPYVPLDISNSSEGDLVLLAAYPAEFAEGGAETNLKASPAITKIQQLLTFTSDSPDVISLGGVSVAQSGSSGGAVLNNVGRLIGIISTTSDGDTTAERDLRAITLSYINRALIAEAGFDIASLLSGDLAIRTSNFMTNRAPALAEQILKNLR